MRTPFLAALLLALPRAAFGSAGASGASAHGGADGGSLEDGGQGLQDEINRLLKEESRMHNELDDHEEKLQSLIQENRAQDGQIDDVSHQLSQKTVAKRELSARLRSMDDELAGLREKGRVAEQAKQQASDELDSRSDVLKIVTQAGADLRRRLEEQEQETESLERSIAASRKVKEIRARLEDFNAGKARIIDEAKEFQDHEAELTRDLARSLRSLSAEGDEETRQKSAGSVAVTRRQYAQYAALAASIPALARELRTNQRGVFESLQGMEGSLRELVQATQ
mmetsp:Transcript_78639/g.222426  ORF Transcript_78639/g.222426 Transcript_78639/m.222426 type:complete len:282 (+) Transcript_78639:76-921(+)